MSNTINALMIGPQAYDIAALASRVVLGGFFVLARFRWIYDPSRPDDLLFNVKRRGSLRRKVASCGFGCSELVSAKVALVEVFAGLALIAGLLTVPAAFGLLAVLIGATCCTAYEKTMRQNPPDAIGVVECYLWTVEPLYIVLAASVILLGPGRYSLDYLLFG